MQLGYGPVQKFVHSARTARKTPPYTESACIEAHTPSGAMHLERLNPSDLHPLFTSQCTKAEGSPEALNYVHGRPLAQPGLSVLSYIAPRLSLWYGRPA